MSIHEHLPPTQKAAEGRDFETGKDLRRLAIQVDGSPLGPRRNGHEDESSPTEDVIDVKLPSFRLVTLDARIESHQQAVSPLPH